MIVLKKKNLKKPSFKKIIRINNWIITLRSRGSLRRLTVVGIYILPSLILHMLNDFFHWDIFNLSLIGYNRDFFNHTVHWLIFANLFLLCYVFNFLLGNVLNFYSINSKQITFTKIIKKNIIIKII